MPTPDFRFEVRAAFTVTGRGTGVVGRVVAGGTRSGEPLFLHADGEVTPVPEAHVDTVCGRESDELALMLKGVVADQVPTGSVLLAHA